MKKRGKESRGDWAIARLIENKQSRGANESRGGEAKKMLRGSYLTRMDEKGRLKIPADFKRFLEEKYGRPDFYITSLNGECARIYPIQVWEEIENKLLTQTAPNPNKKRFLDRTSYYGQMQQVDAQGRILIQQDLRGSAKLVGEVKVFGTLNYMQVWNAEQFQIERIKEDKPFTDDDEASLGI